MRKNDYKPIIVSPDIHRRLADMGRKKETFNDIIAELIELKNNTIRSEQTLEGETHPISSTTALGDPNING
jgi:predicted CopG family antitoxin